MVVFRVISLWWLCRLCWVGGMLVFRVVVIGVVV